MSERSSRPAGSAGLRILVTGSRDWDDASTIRRALEDVVDAVSDRFFGADVTIVHGDCAHGADRIADFYAYHFGWNHERHPADWETHGRKAGPIRNQEMVDAGADICLAFIRNNSRGATGCANLAERAGIPVRRFFVDD